jgi:hypothetical protein
MNFIKVNYSEPVDNFFFGNNYKYEDEDLRYFEDLTLLDQTWNNDEIDMMDNKENISCNQNTPTYHNERLIKEDIPSPDPEDFSLNSLNQRENSEQLVNRFLDSDYPELSPKMQELMKMHDFMKIFIHKITRVPDAVLYNEEEINQGFSIDESVFRKRECIDQVLMKRSYNAFKVLTSYSILNTVTENAKFIGKELLKIFHPKSEGNFNHFKPLWNHLIKITHGEIALLLTSDDEYKEPPIYQMLRYIHEPAITSSLISTIFLFDAEPDLQVELFTKLQEMEFIETLLTMLDMKDFPVIVQATSEFLIQMIEEGSKTKNSSILFAPIQLDPSCLSVIIKHISENKSPVHQQACIQLLLAFLEKYIYYNCDATTSDNVSINTMTSSSSSTLELLKSSLMDYLKYSIDDLCMGLTDAKSIDHVEEDEEDKFYDDYQDFFEEDDDDEEDEEGENDEEEDEDPNKMIVNNHTPIHNHECIHSNTHKHINSSYRRSGCDIYNTNKKLNYKKLKCRLTVNKIGLLKIIIITLQEFKREEYDLLENIPWSLLVNWFFQNPSNNIYHNFLNLL